MQPEILEYTLKSLSDVQRQAVCHDDGALLVLAGPGSGKTRVLTTRIARLLHEAPNEPFRVLALTFTNRAADEMRERIERMAPEAEDRLFIGTFHAFSADVLRQHGQHLGIKTDFRIYSTDEDRAEFANRAIASEAGRTAGLDVRHTDFLPLVDRAKAKLIPNEGLAARFRDFERGTKFEMFYAAYDAALREANAFDFNSLVFNAHQLFVRFAALARRYRAVYRYWCVDEFQDTNIAQYEMLKAMAGEDFQNVFAVADDDQIIYQWNGADYRRLDQFRTDFDAAQIQIPTNFRCPAEVVTCANKLIGCNLLRSADKRPLIANRELSDTLSVMEVLQPTRTRRMVSRNTLRIIAPMRCSRPSYSPAPAAYLIRLPPRLQRSASAPRSSSAAMNSRAQRLAGCTTPSAYLCTILTSVYSELSPVLSTRCLVQQSHRTRLLPFRRPTGSICSQDGAGSCKSRSRSRTRWLWLRLQHAIVAASWIMPPVPRQRSSYLTGGSRTMRPITKSPRRLPPSRLTALPGTRCPPKWGGRLACRPSPTGFCRNSISDPKSRPPAPIP